MLHIITVNWWIALTSQFPYPRDAFPRRPGANSSFVTDETSPLQQTTTTAERKLQTKSLKSKLVIAIGFISIGFISIAISVALVFKLLDTFRTRSGLELPDIADDSHDFEKLFLSLGCNFTASSHLLELTRQPHVAGSSQNFVTAEYVHSIFQSYGIPARYVDYDVLLSYPIHRSLHLHLSNDSTIQFSLQEEAFDGDPYSKNKNVIPSFLAYSPTGNVTAEVVYANYGRKEDFDKLKELGVDVQGAIVIVRYGKIYRGDIVQNAAKVGAVAAIIYSDPQDYAGNGTEGFYPESWWLPPSGVQRGSIFQGIGDPLTPGWPSTSHAERLLPSNPAALLPTIPALPISAQDARSILLSLEGANAPTEWEGSLDLPVYRLGRGPGRLHLSYIENQTVAPIRDVVATIEGSEEPDRYVILGNHRDAWTFGAVDPNSGTASLLELSRRFGKLLNRGWRPRRTIILCSWDAEEYALIGSTEWVEENADLLAARAVAYLNVDCAVVGPGFVASTTPQLDLLLKQVTKKVKDPDAEGSIYDSWVAARKDSSPKIDRLGGGGSDYASFVQHAGIPAMDVSFGEGYPVYHSLYDNYNWMVKFGDPLFHRHVAISSLWGLVALHLADNRMLPFDFTNYAHELQNYARTIEAELKTAKAPTSVTVDPLHSAITRLLNEATDVNLEKEMFLMKTTTHKVSASHLLHKKRSLNDRLLLAERAFLDSDGLPGRSWYKHLVYGPTKNNNYGTTAFPAILDAITIATATETANAQEGTAFEKWAMVQHQIWRVARVIERVALILRGKLSRGNACTQ